MVRNPTKDYVGNLQRLTLMVNDDYTAPFKVNIGETVRVPLMKSPGYDVTTPKLRTLFTLLNMAGAE